MAKIGDFGIETHTLGEWVRDFQDVFIAALGADVSLDRATAIGRIVNELSIRGMTFDEFVTYVDNGQNLYHATGRQLIDYSTLMGIPFKSGSRSTVTVTITGTAGTIVPSGSRIRTSAGAVFETTADALIAQGGTVDVLCRAQRIGPVIASANALTQIVDVISGWTSVTNAAAASPGKNAESESEWVANYSERVPIHGQDICRAPAKKISAELRPELCRYLVRILNNVESNVATISGFSMRANSYAVIVSGEYAAADIAQAIRATAPPGVPITGTITHTLDGQTYRWTDATETAISIVITTTIEVGVFPANGRQEILSNITAFMARQKIGQSVDLARLRSVAVNTAGHEITNFEITQSSNGEALPSTTNAAVLYTLDANDISLTLSE